MSKIPKSPLIVACTFAIINFTTMKMLEKITDIFHFVKQVRP